ncbi:hypothetical protein QBC34DRAFT_335695 [Podospora aff. communis PSN243]|uniref:Uncharacterized protein n=1 Tax=Podospora aff. communis PSN243 TaxID=3040156 RepID=A0AAV9G7I7_9PEZI|nr:hypothetical protein QBC34DRAFT_335695 [Podospora aff. communis PSN243]
MSRPLSPPTSSPFQRRGRQTAGPASSSPLQRQQPRGKPVDAEFVEFLEEYSRRPNVSRNFRSWLQQEVLPQRPGLTSERDRYEVIQYHLRNPRVQELDTGNEFLERAQDYRFSANWRRPDTAYFSQIPPQYLPDETLPATAEPETGQVEDYPDLGDDIGRYVPGFFDALDAPWPATTPRMARRETGSSPQRDSVLGVLETFTPASQAGSGGGAPPPPKLPMGPAPDSWYRGRRQPPLRERLEHTKRFLADEDVDRCATWNRQFDEIIDYLEWLKTEDDAEQLAKAPDETRALFDEVVAMAKTHLYFENHKHGIAPLEISPPPTVPKRPTRLDWAVKIENWPGPSLQPAVQKLDLPRPLLPRPVQPVNTMSSTSEAAQSFARDTAQFWDPHRGEEAVDEPDNLAVVEAKEFDDCTEEGRTEGVRRDAFTRQIILPDKNGTPVTQGDEKAWAKEHGARRAALQYMLRRFNAKEQRGLPLAMGRVTLPLDPGVLEMAREGARRPQWEAPSIPRDQMPVQLDNQPYLVSYKRYLSDLYAERHRAATLFYAKRTIRKGNVLLPQNLVIGGPYIWAKLDEQAQNEADMFNQCQTAFGVLKDANRRAPRKLLQDMIDLVGRGLSGEFKTHNVPYEIQLQPEELNKVNDANLPRYLDPEEIRWIKYLGTDSWTTDVTPNMPKDKYRLFLIFAARVQKLLDDRNPNSLFGTGDTYVTVEQLLQVLNAGAGSSAVDKVEFGPFDAVAWLTRLGETGHVYFRRDISCYGVIGRPKHKYHPEDRVKPERRPKYFEGGIQFARVNRQYPPASGPVIEFFKALAYRLGYTLYMLNWQKRDTVSQPLPPATKLETTISEWKNEIKKLEQDLVARLKEVDPQVQVDEKSPVAWVRGKIIDEISANDTMLAPGREKEFMDPFGSTRQILVRDHNWEWASIAARGRTVPRFMDINRWPQGLGYLSSDEKQAFDQDNRLDPRNSYNPAALDPIDQRFRRPRLKRYGEDRDLVQFRAGRPIFPVGDTRHQQRVIEEYMTTMVHQAVGLTRQPTWGGVLRQLVRPIKRMFPFQGPDDDGDLPPEHPRLRPVNPKRVPRSWNPREELIEEAQRVELGREEMDLDVLDADGYEDLGLEEVDVGVDEFDGEDDGF